MGGRRRLDSWPFMVFCEAIPEAQQLANPNTPTEERERILRELKDTIDVVKAVADGDTQPGRHRANRERRNSIIRDLRVDAHGKPLWGEPRRLALKHKVPLAQVRKWIAQVQHPRKGSEAIPDDWRSVYVGQRLRYQKRLAGKAAAAANGRRRKRTD